MLWGRSALFSDPTIVRRLRTQFVPYAGRRLELDSPRSPLSRWWLPMVRTIHPYYRPGASTQGSYVVGADGTGYAFDNNNRDSRRLHAVLDRGLAGFRQGRSQRTALAELQQDPNVLPPAQRVPEDVSVLQVYTRVRPYPAGEPPDMDFVGRDYMWVTDDEVGQILRAGASGRPFRMPRHLVARLVVFHLVDNTRGQVLPWRPEHVSRADFTARAARTAGGVRSFTFSGNYAKRGPTMFFTDRGHQGRIDGEFDIDTATGKITRFRAYSEAQAWADAPHDRPGNPPPGRYPLVFAMVEGRDALCREVIPEPAQFREYYLNIELPLR